MKWFFKTSIVIRDLSTTLGLSIGTIQGSVHKELGYPKLCVRLVTKCLAEDHKHRNLRFVLVLDLAVHVLTTTL